MFGEGRPTGQLRDNPLTGGIIGPEVSRRNEALFYDLKERAEPTYNTYVKMMKENKQAEAANFYNANRNLIEAYAYTSKGDSALQEANTAIKHFGKVEKTYTPDQKYAEIVRIQKLKDSALDRVIEFRKRAGL